jgi:hypothetical protein
MRTQELASSVQEEERSVQEEERSVQEALYVAAAAYIHTDMGCI